MSLQALNLGCTRGDLDLFAGISFSLSPGDALQVSGRNGCGKSSLLRILCGLAQPCAGEVRWHGRAVARVRDDYHARLIYIGHASGTKDELMAWENLAMAAMLVGIDVSRERAYDALEQVGLEEAADRPARVLSHGQRKRVALARLWLGLAQPLWILDEPFAALDADAVRQLRGLLERHLASGGMLVYTTHQDIPLCAPRMLRVGLGDVRPC